MIHNYLFKQNVLKCDVTQQSMKEGHKGDITQTKRKK